MPRFFFFLFFGSSLPARTDSLRFFLHRKEASDGRVSNKRVRSIPVACRPRTGSSSAAHVYAFIKRRGRLLELRALLVSFGFRCLRTSSSPGTSTQHTPHKRTAGFPSLSLPTALVKTSSQNKRGVRMNFQVSSSRTIASRKEGFGALRVQTGHCRRKRRAQFSVWSIFCWGKGETL